MDVEFSKAHEEARERFLASPGKCYQRHIREVWDGIEKREQLPSLKDAVVKEITNEQAATIILKYEWLQKMGAGTELCYGLFLDEELLGVVCMNKGVQHEARRICNDPTTYDKTIGLCRGACVPHAPKNSASFLIRNACKQAYRDYGYCVFFAYSDPEAGEVGFVYQASNWFCLGSGPGRPKGKDGRSFHTDFIAPDGTRIKTHSVYALATKLGWKKELGVSKRDYLRSKKYTDHDTYDRTKWVWFEGPKRKELKADLRDRFKIVEYPKPVGHVSPYKRK